MGESEDQQGGPTENAGEVAGNKESCGTISQAAAQGWHPEEQQHRRYERGFWIAYIVLTILLAGGAAVSAYFAYQAYVASTLAVVEARRQSNAAYIANRAYISSTAFQLIDYGKKIDGHLQWSLSPIIENTGEHVSKRTSDDRNGQRRRRTTMEFRLHCQDSQVLVRRRTASFDDHWKLVRLQRSASKDDLARRRAGIFKYRDIFGDPHLTEYCFSFFADQPIDFDNYPIGQSIRVGGSIDTRCAKHNCDDEDCGPDWKKRAAE